jgi:hypothetical protein
LRHDFHAAFFRPSNVSRLSVKKEAPCLQARTEAGKVERGMLRTSFAIFLLFDLEALAANATSSPQKGAV